MVFNGASLGWPAREPKASLRVTTVLRFLTQPAIPLLFKLLSPSRIYFLPPLRPLLPRAPVILTDRPG